MTREEYEQRRQRLEAERRAAHELIEAGYGRQLAELEGLWNGAGATGTDGPPPAWTPTPQAPPGRRESGELACSVVDALPQVPEVFTRRHICQAIGYEPNRGSLSRTFDHLIKEGWFTLESGGNGRIPATYRKTGAAAPTAAG